MYNFCPQDEFLARLGRYVTMDTPSADYEHMQLLNAQLEKDLIEAGAAVQRIEASRGDVLVAEVGSGAHRVLLLGHKDTVFSLGGAEKNPFRMEERDGQQVLRGPGVLDMKSGVCMMIELLRHFAASPLEDWRITAIFNCDEEIGSGESSEVIYEYLKQSDYCLCFEPAKPGQCVVARKGLSAYRITAHGISSHSGVNYLAGASAIEGLCRVVSKIYDLRDDEHELSVNVGLIEAPGKLNIVTDYAMARGEMRCYDPKRLSENLEKVREICEQCPVDRVTFDVELSTGRPAMVRTEASEKLLQIAKESAKAHGLSLSGIARGGGSDASFASAMGIPVLDGLGAEGDGSHTVDEFVVWDTLYQRLMTCADLIRQASKIEL
ncbi:MAG: M20/M25/M40 family metallo-hydrolase [Firmicutes bacterium]|nr:M20/M25/M40 family metallo-hydrolase [Bacillota bacterium]